MTIAPKNAMEEMPGNRYKMIAISVTKHTGLNLTEALTLTLIEAYMAMGAKLYGD